MAMFMYVITFIAGIITFFTANVHLLVHVHRRQKTSCMGVLIHFGVMVACFAACAHYAEIVIGL